MTRGEERLAELLRELPPASGGVSVDDVARRVRRRRASVVGAVAAAAVLVGGVTAAVMLTGAGGRTATLTTQPSATTPASVDVAAVTANVPCPSYADSGAALNREQVAAFRPVAAVSCLEQTREYTGEGQWTVSVRQVAVNGVPDLQAAYLLPNEPSGSGGCTLSLVRAQPVALVDADGRWIVPNAPVDGCNKPLRAFGQAVGAVSWQQVSVQKVRQLVSPQAQAAHCGMAWKNENEIYAKGGGATRSTGGPVFAEPPASVHVCVYRTGTDPDAGNFVRGFTLNPSDTARLLPALAGPGPTTTCPAQRDFAVITAKAGSYASWVNVELGGCWRVQRTYPSGGTGTADASVVGSLLDSGR